LSTRSNEESSGAHILRLVAEQVGLGPRVPGTAAHDELARMLEERLRACAADVLVQEFEVGFRGERLHCSNVIGRFRATTGAQAEAPLLLGTHYDTRPQADREPDPALRGMPIPGANDGGSGTAVLLYMLPWLRQAPLTRDVEVAFFDAEDLGNIDGKEFSLGAAYCAANPPWGTPPQEVLVLDMVGGSDMVFDVDAHILEHLPSRRLTNRLFGIGYAQGWLPFVRDKPRRLKYIISDHYPFTVRGIASCILIDIDYPQWHTQADRPEAMSAASLGVTEAALSLFLSPPRS
jgi:glutaminyl-peptide cyclotransferase